MSDRAYGFRPAAELAMYRGVVIDANGKAAYPTQDGDHIFGLTTEAITADQLAKSKVVNVQREGKAFATVGEAVSIGDLLRAVKTTGKLEKAAASVLMDSDNAKSDITFTVTRKYQGATGDEINVTFTDPGGNNQPLAITVAHYDINVSLATDGAGAITSTAAEIVAAIAADAAAADLVVGTPEGDGSGVVKAIAKSYLTGGIGAVAVAREAATADGDQVEVDLGGVI